MRVEIKEFESVNLKNPIIVEGFPGVGMIGTIAATYLADKLKMKLIGYIQSNLFPPIAAIHNFRPVSPARVYASEEQNLIVLFSEFVVPAYIVYELSKEIIEFAKKKKVSMIYSLAGIANPNPTNKIYGIGSTNEVIEKLKKHNVQPIKEGATQGLSGILLSECSSQKFPAANLLAETNLQLDARAAALVIDKVAEMSSIKVETKTLIEEGKKINARIKEAIEKIKNMHKNYKKFEDNPMYG